MLTSDQRSILIGTARQAVDCRLNGRKLEIPSSLDPALKNPCGAFVSLHAGDDLRGCIGMIEASQPLVEVVASCAVSAAISDPRFAPVTLDELRDIRFEISVLSAARR